jgi:hypothetical protein
MATTRDILRSADHLLTAQLQSLGFERQSLGIYERADPAAEADAWLGLNKATYDGVRFFPFVGVRHRVLEAKLAQLGLEGRGPWLTVQLGYLTPQSSALSWSFQGETEADEATAAELTAAVERYALPFVERNRSLETLAASFAVHSYNEQRAYAVPVVYALLGRRELAEQSIDTGFAADGSEAGAEYRAFVERFRAEGMSGTVSTP